MGGADLDLTAYDPLDPGVRPDPFAGILFFSDRSGASVSHSMLRTAVQKLATEVA